MAFALDDIGRAVWMAGAQAYRMIRGVGAAETRRNLMSAVSAGRGKGSSQIGERECWCLWCTNLWRDIGSHHRRPSMAAADS